MGEKMAAAGFWLGLAGLGLGVGGTADPYAYSAALIAGLFLMPAGLCAGMAGAAQMAWAQRRGQRRTGR